MEPSIIISLIALAISSLTAWLTWFHRGKLKMTQPSFIYFGPDQSTSVKVNFRALVYSTAKRGQLIETMFLKLRHNGEVRSFNLWVYGPTKSLVRGGGLFVGYEGVAENHHFLPSAEGPEYQFSTGDYTLEVYASVVNSGHPILLQKIMLNIDEGEEMVMLDAQAGLYFDWNEDTKSYEHHLDNRHAGGKLEKAMKASFMRTDE